MNGRSDHATDTTAPSPPGDRGDAATEACLAHRNLLFTIAYEMLGSAADAEEVLQETWLKWVGVNHDTVEHPRDFPPRLRWPKPPKLEQDPVNSHVVYTEPGPDGSIRMERIPAAVAQVYEVRFGRDGR